jgi:hypothetical protein
MEGSTYMVERYLPGFSAEEMRAAVARAQGACEEMQAHGIAVRYLGSAFIAEEEACFCQFEAPSAAVVEEANRLAEIPFARVVEAVPIRAEGA